RTLASFQLLQKRGPLQASAAMGSPCAQLGTTVISFLNSSLPPKPSGTSSRLRRIPTVGLGVLSTSILPDWNQKHPILQLFQFDRHPLELRTDVAPPVTRRKLIKRFNKWRSRYPKW